MSTLVLVETLERGILTVTLNRPGCRNALSIELLEDLAAEIKNLERDLTHRVVILLGAGPVFSSGLDLREAADVSLIERSAAAVTQALNTLRASPLVSIAAVHGGAFAGGAGLMAACDMAVAAADARFGYPEARRGLIPAVIFGVLRHTIREADLRELLLAGEPIDALRAQQVGLVQRVVSAEQLREEALRVARSVIAGGPQAIRRTKSLLNTMYQDFGGRSGRDLVDAHLAARRSDEAREGLAAFIEKRQPKWETVQGR